MNGFRQNQNKRWEGSRMFLPEHREQLNHIRSQHQKWEPPSLAEDQIAEMNWLLQEAIMQEIPAIITYHENNNQKQSFCGWIDLIPTNQPWLILRNGREKRKIHLTQIVHIELHDACP